MVTKVKRPLKLFGGAEPQPVLVLLQRRLEGNNITTPETTQDTRLQAPRLQ